MTKSAYCELNDELFSTSWQYTPLESLQELWLQGQHNGTIADGKKHFLQTLSLVGLHRKYHVITHEARLRLINEFEMIKRCEMTEFYLILWDLASYATANNIQMSPGCGAIPGSLVAYCLGITDVDPIKHNLLMERFLSQKQEKQTGCRIELEIGGSQRLVDYVIEKYGKGMLKLLEMIDITFMDLEELSVIKETKKRVLDDKGEEIDAIDYNDGEVFELINTEGYKDTQWFARLFNEDFAKGIVVKSMEDLMARLSMDRMGLEERCAEYIDNKNNPERIHYECPELEPILDPTYGYILYQEQIMQILSAVGGFSPEDSNMARRGMSKRQMIVNETGRHDFIKGNAEKGIPGCTAKGISEAAAEKIFDDMWTAGPYSFNKSHAAAYSKILYQLLWLKHHYKTEYMAAVEYVKAIK